MDQLIVFAAEYLIIVPAAVIAGLLAWRILKFRDWRFLAFVIIGGVISLALAKTSGLFISHVPPFAAGNFEPLIEQQIDNSFPSDHTLLAAFLAFATIVIKPKVGWALVIVAIITGLARMAAGVHYSWDVLASFVFALVGTITAAWLVGKVADFVNNKKSPPQEKTPPQTKNSP